jgi:protein O-mannosyl-transferase
MITNNSEPQLISNSLISSLKLKSNKKFIIFYLSIIIVLTFIAYSSSLHNDFINLLDDDVVIINNNDIKEITTGNIWKIFINSYDYMYQPLTFLSFAIEYNFFSLNPIAYHSGNLLLHLFNIILVFSFIYTLTNNLNISMIVALFFGIHPMNVQAIAWITSRSSVMYTFFFLGGLITYLYYLKNQNFIYLALTYILFILSLLSKSAAICFPLVLILIDYYFNNSKFKVKSIKYWINKLPFLIIAIIFGIISINTRTSLGPAITYLFSYSTIDIIFLVFYSASFYIIKLIIPTGLCACHYYPIKSSGILPIEYYLSAVFITSIVISIILIKSTKLRKDIIFGLLFYLATIILVLQIIPFPNSRTPERYAYIPYIGLVFTICKICLEFEGKRFIIYDLLLNQKSYNLKHIFISVIIIAALFFSFMTYERNKVWKNSLTLYSDVAEKNKKDYRAITDRGHAKALFGDNQGAIQDYNKAIENNPTYANAFLNRGHSKASLGDFYGAIIDFDMTIQINPQNAEAYNNRANTKISIGDIQGAIEDYNKVIEMNPKYTYTLINRGNAKRLLGRKEDACSDWKKAVDLGRTDAYYLINKYCK